MAARLLDGCDIWGCEGPAEVLGGWDEECDACPADFCVSIELIRLGEGTLPNLSADIEGIEASGCAFVTTTSLLSFLDPLRLRWRFGVVGGAAAADEEEGAGGAGAVIEMGGPVDFGGEAERPCIG